MNEQPNSYSSTELHAKLAVLEEKQKYLQDKTAAMMNIMEDMEEARVQAEENETKFRAIFESANDGIVLVNLETQHLFMVNQRFAEMTEYTQEELSQMTLSGIHPEDQWSWIQEEFGKAASEKIHHMTQIPFRRKDGSQFIADISSSIITLGGKQYNAGIIRDITERLKAQEQIQQREAELSGIIRAAPIGIGVLINRVFIKVNQRLCDIIGYTEKELIGQNARMLYPAQEDYEYVGREKYAQIREKGTGTVETRWLTKDGRLLDVQISSTPIDIHDWSQGVIFTALDITDRKRIEQEQISRQRELSSIFHSLPVGITQIKDRVFRRVNQIFCESLGYTIDEVIGKQTLLFYRSEEEFHRWGEYLYSELRDRGEVTQEITFRHKDGRFIDFLLRGVYVDPQDPDQGQLFAMIDITERKQAQRALEFTQFSVEHVGIPAFWMNSQLNYLYVNEAACKSLGYSREELLTMSVWENDPDYSKEDHARDWENLQKYGTIIIESRQKTRDGRVFPVEVTANYLLYEGQEYNCAFVRDITERKEAEQAQEKLLRELRTKNEELESIVFIASHDLRSPLVNIEGFTGEVSKACQELRKLLGQVRCSKETQQQLTYYLEKDIPESIRFISAGTAKMDALLSGLLRLSRIGTATIHIEPVQMNLLAQTVLGAMRFEIQRLGAEIRTEDLPNCMGDAVLVNQVFSNLIDNAIKYRHPDRPAHIRITGIQQGDMIHYAVADNGIGIDPRHHEKIFEIFHQLNPGGAQGGQGLGLTIVRRILDRLDGRIRVESVLNTGSTFTVILPRVR